VERPDEEYQFKLDWWVARVGPNCHKANSAFLAGTKDREQLVKDSADSSFVLYLGADLLSKKKNRHLRISEEKILS